MNKLILSLSLLGILGFCTASYAEPFAPLSCPTSSEVFKAIFETKVDTIPNTQEGFTNTFWKITVIDPNVAKPINFFYSSGIWTDPRPLLQCWYSQSSAYPTFNVVLELNLDAFDQPYPNNQYNYQLNESPAGNFEDGIPIMHSEPGKGGFATCKSSNDDDPSKCPFLVIMNQPPKTAKPQK